MLLYLKACEICDCFQYRPKGDRSLGLEHPNTVTVWENVVDFLVKVVSEGKE
ncbi:MAG: hypothetical protein F6J86_18580 [Symploca sp. SIO1B1]|nr:hypothetical protein [Symploca sp. SIO1A3]NER95817.1 hypothetical protein [Symploca sp. SIO1B1]